jgi:hypothetical protein
MNNDWLEYIFIMYMALMFHAITVDFFTRGNRIGLLEGMSLSFYGVHVPYNNRYTVEQYHDYPMEYAASCPPSIPYSQQMPTLRPPRETRPQITNDQYPLMAPAMSQGHDLPATNIYPTDGADGFFNNGFASFIDQSQSNH